MGVATENYPPQPHAALSHHPNPAPPFIYMVAALTKPA